MTPEPASPRGSDYAVLSRQVRQAGLLDRRPRYYAWKITLTAAALALGWAAFAVIGNSWWQLGDGGVPGGRLRPVRLPRPRRRAQPGLPHPAGQRRPRHRVRQPRHRAQLRLVDRQAQPAPRPPQHRGRRPGHRDRRAGLLRRQRPDRAGPPAAGLPLPGLPARPDAVPRGAQPARVQHPHGDRARAAGTGPGRRRCSARTSPPTSARCSWCCRRSRRWRSSLVQQGLLGFYLGCSFAPNHKGMPILAGVRQDRLPAPAGPDLTQRPRRLAHRLRPRRPELPDRAPPVPVHAAAEPAPGPAAGGRVLRRAGRAVLETSLLASYAQALGHLAAVGSELASPAAGKAVPAPARR